MKKKKSSEAAHKAWATRRKREKAIREDIPGILKSTRLSELSHGFSLLDYTLDLVALEENPRMEVAKAALESTKRNLPERGIRLRTQFSSSSGLSPKPL